MFKNKHVVVAMLVAPVLSILAWFAVDYFVSERPHAAKQGAVYKMIAKSNCRYDSGQCDLQNSDFLLSIRRGGVTDKAMILTMTSSHVLQSATLGLVDNGSPQQPSPMTSRDASMTSWQGMLSMPASASATIRVAVTAQGATWFAEVPTVFLLLEE